MTVLDRLERRLAMQAATHARAAERAIDDARRVVQQARSWRVISRCGATYPSHACVVSEWNLRRACDEAASLHERAQDERRAEAQAGSQRRRWAQILRGLQRRMRRAQALRIDRSVHYRGMDGC